MAQGLSPEDIQMLLSQGIGDPGMAAPPDAMGAPPDAMMGGIPGMGAPPAGPAFPSADPQNGMAIAEQLIAALRGQQEADHQNLAAMQQQAESPILEAIQQMMMEQRMNPQSASGEGAMPPVVPGM